MNQEGWLFDPNGRWLLLFRKDPMSWGRYPRFYMDQWSVSSSGTPGTMRSRRRVEMGAALETWNELIQNGWQKVEDCVAEAWRESTIEIALFTR